MKHPPSHSDAYMIQGNQSSIVDLCNNTTQIAYDSCEEFYKIQDMDEQEYAEEKYSVKWIIQHNAQDSVSLGIFPENYYIAVYYTPHNHWRVHV